MIRYTYFGCLVKQNFVAPNQFHRTNSLYFSSASKLLLIEEKRVKSGDIPKKNHVSFFRKSGIMKKINFTFSLHSSQG